MHESRETLSGSTSSTQTTDDGQTIIRHQLFYNCFTTKPRMTTKEVEQQDQQEDQPSEMLCNIEKTTLSNSVDNIRKGQFLIPQTVEKKNDLTLEQMKREYGISVDGSNSRSSLLSSPSSVVFTLRGAPSLMDWFDSLIRRDDRRTTLPRTRLEDEDQENENVAINRNKVDDAWWNNFWENGQNELHRFLDNVEKEIKSDFATFRRSGKEEECSCKTKKSDESDNHGSEENERYSQFKSEFDRVIFGDKK